jgi:hypothetical protein
VAVAEFARSVAGMEGANSTEFDIETPYPVIDLLPEQKEVADLGGTMRLGADPIKLHAGTRAREMYGEAVIYERHRHRYEVNNLLRKRLQSAGLCISGTSPDERLVEVVELDDHPFFVASQFHPEFKSRPERPGFHRGCPATADCTRRRRRRPHARRSLVSAEDRSAGMDDSIPLTRPVCVQAIFHVSTDEQAQAVASRMVDRAHEIANLPECECDVDVSIERTRADDAASMVDAGAAPAHGHPTKL